MEQFISKLSNLGYELFGIFVPGLIFLLFLAVWFWSLGPLPATWTGGAVGIDGINGMLELFAKVGDEIRISTFLMIIALVYFFGHSLHWLSRSGTPSGKVHPLKRTLSCLFFFRLLKPEGAHYRSLEPLLEDLKPIYGFSINARWEEIFPVLKAYLAANLQTSLVGTYQNKYTLHRSIATAAAFWWWLCILSIVASLISVCMGEGHPRWFFLIAWVPASFILVWNFSSSYQYNWHMFANTIITESYMLHRGPKR